MFNASSASAFSFQREAFAAVIDEARPMLAAQWIEAGQTEAGEFALADDRYLAMERVGALRIYTVRHHGVLVGYVSLFVFTGMHAAARAGISDALYVLPAFRRPMVSLRLMRHAEAALLAEGVTVIHMQVNERFPGLGRLLDFMGYKPVSRTFTKVIDHAA
jgi:GNAT superfamily N-acetyltransferase